MPLYEYACRTCGRRFEVLQRIGADSSGVSCPECGGVEVGKQFSTFAAAGGGTMTGGLSRSGASSSSCSSSGFS